MPFARRSTPRALSDERRSASRELPHFGQRQFFESVMYDSSKAGDSAMMPRIWGMNP